MLPQPPAELDHRGLVGRGVVEAEADELAEADAVTQMLFQLRVGEVEPLLQHDALEHRHRRPERTAALGLLGEQRCDRRRHRVPVDQLVAPPEERDRPRASKIGHRGVGKGRLSIDPLHGGHLRVMPTAFSARYV